MVDYSWYRSLYAVGSGLLMYRYGIYPTLTGLPVLGQLWVSVSVVSSKFS